MAMYVGEALEVTLSATDFDNSVPLTNTDVASADVDAYDATGTHLFTSPMTWDPAKSDWIYLWNTTGLTSGTFRLKFTITALDGSKSWEYKRIRLARNPV